MWLFGRYNSDITTIYGRIWRYMLGVVTPDPSAATGSSGRYLYRWRYW